MTSSIPRRVLASVLAVAVIAAVDLQPACASWVGRVPPEVSIEGGMYGIKPGTTLKSMRGDVVLLVFWATTCPKCQRMTALAQRLHKKYAAKGLKTLAIASSSHAKLRQYMRRKGYTFGVASDPRGVNVHRYGIRRYPAAFVISRSGRVVPVPDKFYRTIEAELRKPKPGAGPKPAKPKSP